MEHPIYTFQYVVFTAHGPPPVEGTRQMLDGLGFTHVTFSQRTEHGVEFVKLDLIDLQLAQKVARKGVELLGRFYQLPKYGTGIDPEHPCCAPYAQAFSQTRDGPHDEVG